MGGCASAIGHAYGQPGASGCRRKGLVANTGGLWQTARHPFGAAKRGGNLMGRPVVHFDIGCRDSNKTHEFYAKMFDWKIEPMGPAGMIGRGAHGLGCR